MISALSTRLQAEDNLKTPNDLLYYKPMHLESNSPMHFESTSPMHFESNVLPFQYGVGM